MYPNFEIPYYNCKYMTVGYVLINCELGAEADLIEDIKKLDSVKDVFATFGAHDIMVKVGADNLEKLREVITWEIQKMAKIRSTVSLIKKDIG